MMNKKQIIDFLLNNFMMGVLELPFEHSLKIKHAISASLCFATAAAINSGISFGELEEEMKKFWKENRRLLPNKGPIFN